MGRESNGKFGDMHDQQWNGNITSNWNRVCSNGTTIYTILEKNTKASCKQRGSLKQMIKKVKSPWKSFHVPKGNLPCIESTKNFLPSMEIFCSIHGKVSIQKLPSIKGNISIDTRDKSEIFPCIEGNYILYGIFSMYGREFFHG